MLAEQIFWYINLADWIYLQHSFTLS